MITFGMGNYWNPMEIIPKGVYAKFGRSLSQCAPSKNVHPSNPNYAKMATWAPVGESGYLWVWKLLESNRVYSEVHCDGERPNFAHTPFRINSIGKFQ